LIEQIASAPAAFKSLLALPTLKFTQPGVKYCPAIGLSLTYTYISLGYAQQITGPGAQVYWTANARDAEMHLTQQTAGNGVVTNQGFDPQTGRLTAILAGAGNIVENFSYTYDVLGNVLTRADANENLTETFTYDNLNRMTSATVSQNIAPVKTFAYDAIGNLLSKSDVGAYTYPLAGSALAWDAPDGVFELIRCRGGENARRYRLPWTAPLDLRRDRGMVAASSEVIPFRTIKSVRPAQPSRSSAFFFRD